MSSGDHPDFRHDTRGLGIGIVAFGAIVAIGGMLFALLFLEGLVPMMDSASSQAQTQQGADQIALAKSIATSMSVYIMFLAGLFLIARSVVESRGPG